MIDNRENNIWTVYVHIVPKTITKYDYDKYYVGITSRPVKKRWRKNGVGYKGQPFYCAIQKYGWDNIEHYIIAEHLTEDEADKLEIELIKKLSCNISNNDIYGYNCCNGGNSSIGYKSSEEIKNKIFQTNLLKSNYIETYQFDLNFNFIKKYPTTESAGRETNTHATHIRDCIYNNFYSYNGYIWRCKDDVEFINGTYKPINLKKKPKSKRQIYQFDLNGNFIASYKRLNEILNFDKNINTHYIYQCLSHSHQFSYGYIWRYIDDDDIIITENNIPKLKYQYKKKPKKNDKCVYKFDLNGNFIEKYSNCAEAGRDNNIDPSYLLKVAKGCSKKHKYIAKNFIWLLKENIDFDKNNKPILKGDDKTCV